MAFLGLFSRRDKHKVQDVATDSASAASDLDPSEPDYVLPSSSKGASLYSVPAASSSKLRLGFKSKKLPPAPRTDTDLLSPPSAFQSFRSESENDLSPPPPRSAVFAGYGDPTGAHSTRSLPNDPIAHSRSASKGYVDRASGAPLPPPQKNSKGSGLFSWAHRERKKSKAPPPPPQLAGASRPDVSLDSESFNLRSFRHVRPESPNEPPPSMMPPVRPRPRENSFTSDTSQRISVAAFREAQARRSAANSPTPPPVTMLSPGSTTGLRPPSTFAMRNSRSISGDSDTDDSEEGDSSPQEATLKPRHNRSTKPGNVPPVVVPGKKSVSELGHKASPTTAPLLPHMTASASTNPAVFQNDSSKESVYARPRASASTSALQPNAAARRASLILTQQTKQQPQPQRAQPQPQGKPAAAPAKPASKTTRPVSSPSSSSSSSSEDSGSDDAPLAQLVGPKRPGSAASSAPSSTSRSRLPPKPLINIAGIAPPTFPPVFAEIHRPPVPVKDSPQPPNAPSPKASIPSPGHASKPSINDRLARIAKGVPTSIENVDKFGHKTRVTPTRSQTQPVESLSLPPKPSDEPPISSTAPGPLRLVNGRSMSSPNTAFEDIKVLSESSPIVPIPIRTRTPPPTFAVTSRPSSQFSQDQQSGPDPRASEETVRMRQRASTLLADAEFASNKGFTGEGLLAGGSPVPQGTPTPASRGRQRSSTLIATPSVSTTQFPSVTSTATPPRPNARIAQDLLSRPNARVAQDPPPRSNVRISQDPPRLVARSSSPDSSKSATTSDAPSSKAFRSTFKPKSALKNSAQSSPVAPPSSRQTTFDSLATPPPKPFTGSTYTVALRGNSPASSTGDSSSGRTPITPVDGGEIRAASAARKRGHRKSSSTAFDQPSRSRLAWREQEKVETSDPEESRRRERRRSEAKAAIELGKIVNGRGPIATDDDDEGNPMNMGPRMGMFNPMMGAGMSPIANSPMAWSQPATASGMMNPMYPMMTPNGDPMLLAAHQQAMMVAKQAFQMAYAQQALAAANEEWERGSTAASVYSGGMGGMGGMPGMGGMGGMGGGLMPGMMPWGMQMFPSSQSMYAGSVIGGSEIGGPNMAAGRGVGWGSRTTYGVQGGYTGSAAERASAVYRNSQFLANGLGIAGARSEVGGPTAAGGRGQPRQRTKTGPESPQQSPGTPGKRGGPPPSSWNTRGSKPA